MKGLEKEEAEILDVKILRKFFFEMSVVFTEIRETGPV